MSTVRGLGHTASKRVGLRYYSCGLRGFIHYHNSYYNTSNNIIIRPVSWRVSDLVVGNSACDSGPICAVQ